MSRIPYLTKFYEEFNYPTEAAESLLRAFAEVEKNPLAKETFHTFEAAYRQDYNCNYTGFLDECASMAKKYGYSYYALQLLMFQLFAEHTKELYTEKGIDTAIWYDSVCDLKYKAFECKAVYGVWGTWVASWFPRFYNLTRFALGRLQFEVDPFRRTYEKNGLVLNEESPVVNVHIPRTGTRLDAASCEDAYRRAQAFFGPSMPDGRCTFVCSSWLLWPGLKEILPESSNILRFMSDYDVINTGLYGDEHPELWRLFDTQERNPDRLPADSSARRAFIAHLKKGGKTGWGFGVYRPNF